TVCEIITVELSCSLLNTFVKRTHIPWVCILYIMYFVFFAYNFRTVCASCLLHTLFLNKICTNTKYYKCDRNVLQNKRIASAEYCDQVLEPIVLVKIAY